MAKARGMVVFYVDVGQLPCEKADALTERVHEKILREGTAELPDDVMLVVLPVRDARQVCVQFVPFG